MTAFDPGLDPAPHTPTTADPADAADPAAVPGVASVPGQRSPYPSRRSLRAEREQQPARGRSAEVTARATPAPAPAGPPRPAAPPPRRPRPHGRHGRPEPGPDRRTVLRVGLAGGLTLTGGLVAAALKPAWWPTAAPQQQGVPAGPPRDVLVVLTLRGGFDALSAVVPFTDPALRTLRPTLAPPISRLVGLDGRFAVPEALAALVPLWQSGRLGVVWDVGQPEPTGSHRLALERLARGAPGAGKGTGNEAGAGRGWLDRTLALRRDTGPFQATQLGAATRTAAWLGEGTGLTVRALDGLSLWDTWDADSRARADTLYRELYGRAPAGLREPATRALDAVRAGGSVLSHGYTPRDGIGYPDTATGTALRDLARLLRGGVPVEVAAVDVDGWDLHARPDPTAARAATAATDTAAAGAPSGLADLAGSLAAFSADLGPELDRVTVVTLTEFGRTVAENGSGGTDHGRGSLMFVLGGAVQGGRFHGNWPGLGRAGLIGGGWPGRVDYRQVLAEVLTGRCALTTAELATVFPGLRPAPLGVVRPRG